MSVPQQLTSCVSALFPRAGQPRTTRIGIEHELLTRYEHDGSVPSIERIRRAGRGSGYEAFLGFEPGGQVELSLPPVASIPLLERMCFDHLYRLRSDCSAIGIALDDSPVDPQRTVDEVPLQLRRPRYLAMQRHFDSIGPQGRRMMRMTASTQVCLDWWPGAVGLEQWRLANLAGPALAAIFSRGDASRTGIWLSVDPGRTAFDDRLLCADPITAYADFAFAAATFGMPGDADVRRSTVTFAQWWAAISRPTLAALDHHLSTLFPPVRPRGRYLEVRYLDVQPDDRIADVASVLRTLLYDDAVRRRALDLLTTEGTLAEKWWLSSTRHPDLLEEGGALIALVAPRHRLELEAVW